MPGKILGIDINRDFISAVQVVRGLKGFQVVSCHSVMIDKDNDHAQALQILAERMDLKSGTYIASIDAGNISFHNLSMPFKDPKKIKQTLPFELETLVPFPIEDLVIDFNIIRGTDKSDILAVSAKKTVISEYLEGLKRSGVTPGLIDIRPVPVALWLLTCPETPDCGLVMDLGQQSITVALFVERRVALVRNISLGDLQMPGSSFQDNNASSGQKGERLAKAIQPHLKNTLRLFSIQFKAGITPEKAFITGAGSLYPGIADALSGQLGISVEITDISKQGEIHMDADIAAQWNPALTDNALSLALREIKKGHGFNLRKGEFEVKKNFLKTIKELRKVGIALLIIIGLLMADLGVDYYLVKKRYAEAEARCAELFRQSFPDAKNVKYPLLQMKQKIEEVKKTAAELPGSVNNNQRVLDLINDISQRISKTVDMDLSKMVIDTETVILYGETDSFATVNSLEGALKGSSYFSDVSITNEKQDTKTGKRVEFEFKLQRK